MAFAFVPAKPPLGRVGTALLMACCSLQQELGAWCHVEGTSYVSGITMDAEGVGWSLRYFLPPLGFLDAVVPHAVVSTASKAPMGLGSCRAVELWAQLLLCINEMWGQVQAWPWGGLSRWDWGDWSDLGWLWECGTQQKGGFPCWRNLLQSRGFP